MRLRTLYIIYVLCTLLATATPFVAYKVDVWVRATKPVNSEPPLESAPALTRAQYVYESERVLPACISADGTEYYGGRGWFYANVSDKLYFYKKDDLHFRSCSIALDGTVYITASDFKEGALFAYSPFGQLKWSALLPPQFGQQSSRTAISKAGTLYICVRESDVTRLIAYHENGAELWEVPLESGPKEHWGSIPDTLPAPIIGPDGTIYAVSSGRSPDLVAVSSGGSKLWSTTLPTPPTDFIVGPDSRIFVPVHMGCDTDFHRRGALFSPCVLVYGSNGQKLWQFSSGEVGSGAIALAADGTLYFASRGLYALDAGGKQKWVFRSEFTYTQDDHFVGPLLLGQDGTIYAESAQRQLYAITPQGRKKWHLDKRQVTNVSVGKENSLTDDGTLIILAGRMQVGSGLAKGGWPTENHDNRNSRSVEAQ